MGVIGRLHAALRLARRRLLRAARRAVRLPLAAQPQRTRPLRRWPNVGTLPSEVMAAAYGGTSSSGVSARGQSTDVQGMRRDLAVVLDAHEGSRRVFRYLAHFEKRLAAKGLRVIDEMSVPHLRRALAQFEAIITDWSPANLAELRSRMAVAVSARDSAAALWAPPQTLSHAYEPKPMPLMSGAAAAGAGAPAAPPRQVANDAARALGHDAAASRDRSIELHPTAAAWRLEPLEDGAPRLPQSSPPSCAAQTKAIRR
jgi:hypothetical protein